MKRLAFLAIGAAIFLSSCGGADQATVDKMTGEMCDAMAIYNEEDPMSMLDAASAMLEISEKEDEYGSVTEDQLYEAMEAKCPDGYKKFKELAGTE